MSKMALHEPFEHMQPKLWAKKGPGIQLKVGNRPDPDVRWGSATWR